MSNSSRTNSSRTNSSRTNSTRFHPISANLIQGNRMSPIGQRTAVAIALMVTLLPTFTFLPLAAKPMKPVAPPVKCTPSTEPGITVKVFDAKTRQPLRATVMIQDGTFQEVLGVSEIMASGQVIYGGAFERPGRYTIRVTQEGYRPTVLQAVEVTKDTCHVVTRRLAVVLQPGK